MYNVAIIGGGVIGLPTALAIQEKLGHKARVTVFTKELSPNTTGDIAAGLWIPYLLQDTPEEKVLEWSKATLHYLVQLWREGKADEAGITLQTVLSFSQEDNYKVPNYFKITLGYSILNDKDLEYFTKKLNASKKLTAGISYVSFSWEASKFLPYLQQKFLANGGNIVIKDIGSFDELCDFNVIVNCCGIASRLLVPDPEVHAVRGQIARVSAPWQNHSLFIEDGDLKWYIIANQECVILGGTNQKDDYSTEVCQEDKRRILSGNYRSIPALEKAPIIKHQVGLRPGRFSVRVELEKRRVGGKIVDIVHNYGHGGSGITLSIGCAKNAAELVEEALNSSKSKL